MIIRKRTTLLIFAGIAFSCKTTTNTDLKALSDFQESGDALVCSAEATADFSSLYETLWPQGKEKMEDASIIAPAAYKEKMKPILASVPLGLQSHFFKFGGKLQLIGGGDTFCANAGSAKTHITLYDGEGNISGCVSSKNSKGSESNQPVPNIFTVVTANTNERQIAQLSSMVQGFSVLAAFFTTEMTDQFKLEPNTDLQVNFSSNDGEFTQVKTELAFLHAEDVMNATGENKTSIPESYTQLVNLTGFWDKNQPRQGRWASFYAARNSENVARFINFAFATLLEASMCNDETRRLIDGPSPMFIQAGSYFGSKVAAGLDEAWDMRTGSSSNETTAQEEEKENPSLTMSKESAPDTSGEQFALAGGFRFPILGRVVRAPYAVGRFWVNKRPILSGVSWVADHKPVRRLIGRAGIAVGRGFRAAFPGNRCFRIRRRFC